MTRIFYLNEDDTLPLAHEWDKGTYPFLCSVRSNVHREQDTEGFPEHLPAVLKRYNHQANSEASGVRGKRALVGVGDVHLYRRRIFSNTLPNRAIQDLLAFIVPSPGFSQARPRPSQSALSQTLGPPGGREIDPGPGPLKPGQNQGHQSKPSPIHDT